MNEISQSQEISPRVVIAKDGRIMNPRSMNNLPGPGTSGNPGGMPKGTPKISVAIAKFLACATVEECKPENVAEEIALAQIKKARRGTTRAFDSVTNRTEGGVSQSITVRPGEISTEELGNTLVAPGIDVALAVRLAETVSSANIDPNELIAMIEEQGSTFLPLISRQTLIDGIEQPQYTESLAGCSQS